MSTTVPAMISTATVMTALGQPNSRMPTARDGMTRGGGGGARGPRGHGRGHSLFHTIPAHLAFS